MLAPPAVLEGMSGNGKSGLALLPTRSALSPAEPMGSCLFLVPGVPDLKTPVHPVQIEPASLESIKGLKPLSCCGQMCHRCG